MTKKSKTTVLLPDGSPIPDPPPKGQAPLLPVYYNPGYHIPLVEMFARQGMTIAQIAEQCGIETREFAIWRGRYPDIDLALQKGHALAQAVVENKLFEAALGLGQIVEQTHVERTNEQGEVAVEEKTVIKQPQPNVKAMMYILNNIAPDNWKNKQEVSGTHELEITWVENRSELTPQARVAIKALPVEDDE